MKFKTCAACGQIIPPENPFRDKKVKARIYEFIVKHPEGLTPNQLKDYVYADDIDGGPMSSSIMSNHIRQMNTELVSLGVRIWMRRGPSNGYRLVSAENSHG